MPRGYTSSARAASVALAALLIAGTALLRGGVDLPVVAAAAAISAAVLALSPRARSSGAPAPALVPLLAAGLAAAVLLIALQLVPVPPALIRAISPATAEVLEEALSAGSAAGWRPLSLAPAATALELAKAAVLACLVAGAAILAESPRRRDQLLRAVALSGAAVSAVHYGAALLGLAAIAAPRVTFVNSNHAAAFFQLAAWTALGFALRGHGPARAGWLGAFALSASGVFLSLSRGAMGAFVVGAAVLAVLHVRRERDVPREREAPARARGSAAFAGIAAVVAAVGLAGFLALDAIARELRTVSELTTSDVKLGLWADAVAIVRDFPLVGIGRGAFATVSPAYERESSQLTFTHVENEWLQAPVDLGLPAGVAVVALFVWAFVAAARRRELSRPVAGGLAGAAAVAAQNLFDFSLAIPGVAIPFSVVLGVAAREMPRLALRPLAVRGGAAALLLLAAVGLGLHAAHAPEREPASVADARSGDEAARRAAEVAWWHPADWVPLAAVGAKLASEDRCAEAVPWLTRAMRRNPYAPEPHRVVAVCLARAGRHALAQQEFRLAFLHGDRGALETAFAYYGGPGELLALAPRTPDALLETGRILRDDPGQAAAAWQEAWESFGETRALAHLAAAKLALGEHGEALRFARALEAHPAATPAAWVVASRALDALGRAEEALAELEVGAARHPGSAELLVPLGYRHLSERRFSRARATFDSIVATEGPGLARKRMLVARALEGQGRHGEALREAQVARDVAPADVAVLEGFSRIAATAGRYADAIDALEVAARSAGARPGAYGERLAKLRAARAEQLARGTAPAR